MKWYRVRVREVVIAEYLIEADSEQQAADWIACGLRPLERTELETPDWEFEGIEEADAEETRT